MFEEMLLKFEKKVAEFVKVNGLFDSPGSVLLAVSGGADSVAMMHAIWRLTSENILHLELCGAHINHHLRGTEADLDEEFVVTQAAKFNLPLTVRRVDVRDFARDNRLSIETAARKLRLNSLLDIGRANNCSCIATGHQKNDNAETVLHRLMRGTGFRGLSGIWPVRTFENEVKFVRPLLCVTREEIVEYLQQRNMQWRVDHTNADCSYTRNHIRHQLLPALQQNCSGSVVQRLSELAQTAYKFYSLVRSRAEAVWPKLMDFTDDKVALILNRFVAEPRPVRVELVRRSLAAIGSGERDLSHRHYESILQLAERKVGGRTIELPAGFTVRREYGTLLFAGPGESPSPERESHVAYAEHTRIRIPGQARFGRYLIRATVVEREQVRRMGRLPAHADSQHGQQAVAHPTDRFVEWFDLDKLKPPMVVRSRQEGDRFWPLGLAGQKKVGKFLTTAKVPQQVRRKVLIIADSEKVIWVWPIRMSEQAKVTTNTREILQLQIISPDLAD